MASVLERNIQVELYRVLQNLVAKKFSVDDIEFVGVRFEPTINGRLYGAGLFKIKVYELKNLPVVNPSKVYEVWSLLGGCVFKEKKLTFSFKLQKNRNHTKKPKKEKTTKLESSKTRLMD